MENNILLPLGQNDIGRRLDRILRKILPGHRLSTIYGDLRKGRIRVNGKKRKGSYRIKEGDSLLIPEEYKPRSLRNDTSITEPFRKNAQRQDMSLIILHEDTDFLICSKEAGRLTHGDKDDLTKDVIAYLAEHYIPEHSLAFTPGPLHRLDRNTSGILYFNKSIHGARVFSSLQKSHCLTKIYIAVVEGTLFKAGVWENVLWRNKRKKITQVKSSSRKGRPSQCYYRPIAFSKNKTLLSIELRSGFTHQIRVQSGYNGHPLYGDTKYGGKRSSSSYLLHALTIYNECPTQGMEQIPQVLAPIPAVFSSFIQREFSLSSEKAIEICTISKGR